MSKFISLKSTVFAVLTMLIGYTAEASELVNLDKQNTNPELIRFLAPIIAGLLGKLIDNLFHRRKKKEDI